MAKQPIKRPLPSLGFKTEQDHKISHPVGMLLDIPTGYFVPGVSDQMFLNGGFSTVVGVAGTPNTFKSTVSDQMILTALARLIWSFTSQYSKYDTESSQSPARIINLASRLKDLFGDVNALLDNEIIVLTDKTFMWGEAFVDYLKTFCAAKLKNADDYKVTLPIFDRRGAPIEMLGSTFSSIDSLTEFYTSYDMKAVNDNSLGASERNAVQLRASNSKAALMTEITGFAPRANHRFALTAHIGRKTDMGGGRFSAPPEVLLQQLKHGDALKGVSNKFSFLTSMIWQTAGARPLMNDTTKSVEFPRDSDENKSMQPDLNLVIMRLIRNKHGQTGATVPLLVSQEQGVLSEMSEFYYIKSMEKWGIGGTDRNYHLELCPDVSLSRTTIRGKFDTTPELRRAVNITSELRQMIALMPQYRELYCTPKQLHDDLVQMGYNWNDLLATRGWFTYNNEEHPVRHLSTLDLLRTRKGLYKPYWME